jgi:hypothetical protein
MPGAGQGKKRASPPARLGMPGARSSAWVRRNKLRIKIRQIPFIHLSLPGIIFRFLINQQPSLLINNHLYQI